MLFFTKLTLDDYKHRNRIYHVNLPVTITICCKLLTLIEGRLGSNVINDCNCVQYIHEAITVSVRAGSDALIFASYWWW